MAGVLFIVNVPKKEYEKNLRRTVPTVSVNKDKYKNASKVIHELKEHLGTKPAEVCVQDDDNGVITKCRSTDCLHKNKVTESYKCKSESCLTDGPSVDRKSYLKTSWEEMKQVINPRKNKLKITRPVRGVDILEAFYGDTSLEIILSEVIKRLDIKNAAWNSTKDDNFWQVTFSLESGTLSEELLQVLRTFGIGTRYQSSVSLLPCALFYQSNDGQSPPSTEFGGDASATQEDASGNTAWSRFSSSVRARNNLAQVLHDVRADAALTFDWVFLLLVAAFVAAIGLIENSTVILVASMLISPLMGPITAGTLGTAVQDRSLQLMGLKNEFLGLFLSLVMGFLFGLAICAIDERYGVVEDWPTYEMISRCEYRSLWVGVLVAIPSGAGVALAVLGEYTASLVGVAISASLLPPAVNAGLLWAMALTRLTASTEELRWLVVMPSELAVLGTASLCLTLVNIVCIFLAGVAVYKVKEVSPLDRKDISWWKPNKSCFHTVKQNKDNVPWDSYTKWYNDTLDNQAKDEYVEENDKPIENSSSPGPVRGNKIMFRKQPSLIKRLRPQNINASHSAQLLEDYSSYDLETKVDLETHTDRIVDNNENNHEINNETQEQNESTYDINNEMQETNEISHAIGIVDNIENIFDKYSRSTDNNERIYDKNSVTIDNNKSIYNMNNGSKENSIIDMCSESCTTTNAENLSQTKLKEMYSFLNLGYNGEPSDIPEHPIIEPSQNYTIDHKVTRSSYRK